MQGPVNLPHPALRTPHRVAEPSDVVEPVQLPWFILIAALAVVARAPGLSSAWQASNHANRPISSWMHFQFRNSPPF